MRLEGKTQSAHTGVEHVEGARNETDNRVIYGSADALYEAIAAGQLERNPRNFFANGQDGKLASNLIFSELSRHHPESDLH